MYSTDYNHLKDSNVKRKKEPEKRNWSVRSAKRKKSGLERKKKNKKERSEVCIQDLLETAVLTPLELCSHFG
jgi:hypothetical protein